MTAVIDHKTSLISRLISSCYRAQDGYRSAAIAVEDDALRRLFEIYAQQRTRFADELRDHLPISNEVNEDIVTEVRIFRDERFLTGQESIRECLEIDSRTVELYREALAHGSLPTRAHFLISSQLALLQRVHDRMRTMLHDSGARTPHQGQRLSA